MTHSVPTRRSSDRMRLHSLRPHGVAACRTGQHRAEVMPAGEMPVQHRRAPAVVVIAVAPVHQAEDHRIEIATLVSQAVFVAQWSLLIGHARQHALAHRLVERSEEHTSELQSLMRISYAVFCLKKKKTQHQHT